MTRKNQKRHFKKHKSAEEGDKKKITMRDRNANKVAVKDRQAVCRSILLVFRVGGALPGLCAEKSSRVKDFPRIAMRVTRRKF